MLEHNKRIFWEALIVTIAIFIIGLFIGIFYEGSHLNEVNQYYSNSEVSLMDALSLNILSESFNLSCNTLVNSTILFADRIYEEAKILEDYEHSRILKTDLLFLHRKYDLLRTLLWTNSLKIVNKCPSLEIIPVIYLYEYQTLDLVKKAKHNVWSKILFDLKQKYGSKILLIPIAVDSKITSLDSMIMQRKISSFPIVIIRDKTYLTEISSVEEIENYLK